MSGYVINTYSGLDCGEDVDSGKQHSDFSQSHIKQYIKQLFYNNNNNRAINNNNT